MSATGLDVFAAREGCSARKVKSWHVACGRSPEAPHLAETAERRII